MFAISTIIPVYRGRNTIGRAIDSVNMQSVLPIEIIVVDNEPDSELETFIPSGPCSVRVLREARKGAAFARNLGMAAAQGTHCAFLDCDDEWDAGYLRAMSRAITRSPKSCLFAGASLIRTDDRVRYQRPPRFGKNAITRLLLYNAIATSGAVVDTAAARACGGFLEGLSVPAGEDWALWLKMLRYGRGIPVPDALVIRHETPNDARVGLTSDADLELAARHALGQHPSGPEIRATQAGIFLRRGTEHLRQGRRRDARRCFRRAVSLYPFSRHTWLWLGVALLPARLETSARNIRLALSQLRRHEAGQARRVGR